MSILLRLGRWIRHLPRLERADRVWDLLRGPYRRLLDMRGQGVLTTAAGACVVRIPVEFTGSNWEKYEPGAIRKTVGWLRDHPDAWFLDVGCASGIYSCVALFASEHTRVVAFDSDISSLKATRRLCCHATGQRLELIHGLVSDRQQGGMSYDRAIQTTREELARDSSTGAPGTTRYICLGDVVDRDIPVNSLDKIFEGIDWRIKSMLLKCDVEGAEFFVLRGGRGVLDRWKPQLLISIHPARMEHYGHSVVEIQEYLRKAGYHVLPLETDHEEHWWCTPNLTRGD